MSFNTEKNVPEVKFIADSTKRATGLYGPEAILSALIEIVKMFDPESTHSDNVTPGGISKENLREELRCLIENSVQKIEGMGLSECNYSRDDSVTLEECAGAKHTHGYDEKPTAMSNNLLTSGAIHNVVNDIAEKIQIILESYSKKEETEEALSNYVKKEDGKSLSRNDYTDSDKQNLDENTQARHTHIYDEAPTKDSTNSITSGAVNDALLKYIPHISTGIKDPNVPVWTIENNAIVFKYWVDDGGGTGWYNDYYFGSTANIALRALQDEYGNIIADTYTKLSQFYALDGDVAALNERVKNCPQEPTVVYLEANDNILSLEASYCDNCVFQAKTLTSLTFGLYMGSFSPIYTCSINFTSGKTPTRIQYTNAGVINWRGTDCYLDEDYSYMDDGSSSGPLSIFSPVANKRYNIVIYFDGQTFVACVNGFVQQTMDNILGG